MSFLAYYKTSDLALYLSQRSSIYSRSLLADKPSPNASSADLREVLCRLHKKCGTFGQLIKDDPKTWKELVRPNVCYILHEVLLGLCYLHWNNTQHGDLKGWWNDLE